MVEKIAVLLTASVMLSTVPDSSTEKEIATANYQVSIQETEASKVQAQEGVIVSFDEKTELRKNSSDIIMMESKYKFPIVQITGNKAASDKINTYYTDAKVSFQKVVNELTAYAEEDYKERNKEQLEYWNGYFASMEYQAERADDQIISLVGSYSEYTGGAHPNATKFADNFSVKTGERLAFKDVVEDEAEARKTIVEYIIKETKKAEYADYFFDDYEKNIPDLLTDTTWYFSNKGLVVIANEYIIGPHAMGIVEFTIPYAQAGFLKDSYLPRI